MTDRFESGAREGGASDMFDHFRITRDPSINSLVDMGIIPGVTWDNDLIGQALFELGEPQDLPDDILPIEIRLAGDDWYEEMIKQAPNANGTAEVVETDAGLARIITLPLFVRFPEYPELNYFLRSEEALNLTLVHELKHAVDYADPTIRSENQEFAQNLVRTAFPHYKKQVERQVLPLDIANGCLAIGSLAYALKTRRLRNLLATIPLFLATDALSSVIATKLLDKMHPQILGDLTQKLRHSPFEERAYAISDLYQQIGVPPMIRFARPETTPEA